MSMSCRRPGCVCTHTGECDAGFINLTDPVTGRDVACKPCPRCNPTLAEIIATSPTSEDKQLRIGVYAAELHAAARGRRRAAVDADPWAAERAATHLPAAAS